MVPEDFGDEMQEILNEFIIDTKEQLDELDNKFIELENNPDDLDLLNEIFRTIHSIKGAAGFLGFDKLVEVAHDTESVLNKLRKGEFKVTPNIMDIILDAVDLIKEIVTKIENGEDISSMDVSDLTAQLKLILMDGEKYEPIGYKSKKSKTESTQKTEEKKEEKKEPADEQPEKETKEEAPKLGEILVEEKAISKEQLLEALEEQDKAPKLGEVLVEKKMVSPKDVEKALEKQKAAAKKGAKKSTHSVEQTIRVEIRRLDNVMNLVGELVLGRNRLVRILSKLEHYVGDSELIAELAEVTSNIDLITTDLQLAVMKTRMQPIRKVFAKFPKMVRSLAREFGKKINLEIYGESTELDKSVIEVIGDPLVHLIRNSVDHGIEYPEERKAAGKPETGTIVLSAEHEGNNIIIKISDDGRGIDIERVKEKAIERGLISAQDVERLSKTEILNFIFEPGFSTAKKVTSVSGRGVGMDVVKTNITKLNGTIEIDSELGKGTTITLKLPLTVAIIQALMVEVGNEIYAIPLSSISETLFIEKSEIKTVNKQSVYKLRDIILPLVELRNLFNVTSEKKKTDENTLIDDNHIYIVVLSIGEKKLGLIVDDLVGQEEIVIKSMGDFLSDIKGISGATITGDGKVVLIIDVQNLMLLNTYKR